MLGTFNIPPFVLFEIIFHYINCRMHSQYIIDNPIQAHHFRPLKYLSLNLQLFEFNGSTFQVQQNDQSSDYIGELM